MKNVLLGLLSAILCFTLFSASNDQQCEVTQAEISSFTQTFTATKAPLQVECCTPGDATTTTISFGARCQPGRNYCAENACPSGTSECGTSGN